MQKHGYYGHGSVAWKINREAAILLGGARAVLMQLAHPLVAAGVSDHSSYMTDPFGRAEQTFLLGQMLTFGSSTTARHAARTINRLHIPVQGTLSTAAGAYDGGTSYKARDPELLLWVHATLVDSILMTYLSFVGPLSPEEQNEYYQESKLVAHALGLSSAAMPTTILDLQQYVYEMVQSNRLAATPQGRRLARQVLFPHIPSLLRPLIHLNLQITCALLPQPIREIYGLEWGKRRQYLFDLSNRGVRVIMPRLPLSLRILPITHKLIREDDNATSNTAKSIGTFTAKGKELLRQFTVE